VTIAGERDPSDLMPLVYAELHELARHYLSAERADHTLQPTALVHEAFLRLKDRTSLHVDGPNGYFAVAAQAMRRVLVDHARHKRAVKRGQHWDRVTLDDAITPFAESEIDLVVLDDLLARLAEFDPRACQVVELRFFCGLSIDETARALGVSDRTVDNDWYVARAWLARQLSGPTTP
jgi:RNA polymerase sigma factor (TIGR02999 family)